MTTQCYTPDLGTHAAVDSRENFLNARLFVRTATIIAALGATLSVVACSAAPAGDATGRTDDALTPRTPLRCGPFQQAVTTCAPGEGVGGGTVCGQNCELLTGPVCTSTEVYQVACGATLPAPVAGCLPGIALGDGGLHSANVWLCNDGTPVPTSIRPASPNWKELIVTISSSQHFCSRCVGAPLPGSFLLVEWQEMTDPGANPNNCGGPCLLNVGP